MFKISIFKTVSPILFLLLLFSFFSCTSIPESFIPIIEKSGDNSKEIQKAIRYFQRQDNQEKMDALFFLLDNMDNKFSYKGRILEKYNQLFYKDLDSLNYPDFLKEWEKIEKRYGRISLKNLKKEKDIHIVTSDFLIENIEIAFQTWKEEEWTSHIDLKTFYESILPHRSSTEPLENWRSLLYNRYIGIKDTLENPILPVDACIAINNELKTWMIHHNAYDRYPIGIKASDFLEGKRAVCRHKDNFIINACRSVGLPVVTHFTPFWADRDEGHSWCALITKDDRYFAFQGAETIDTSSITKVPLPYKAAKIFQETFAPSKTSLTYLNSGKEEIPFMLDNKFLEDVTSYYPPSFDVPFMLPDIQGIKKDFAYLAVFNQPYWLPIFWADASKGENVVFKDMKEDVVYLPVYYHNKNLIPLGQPFLLNKIGEIKPIVAIINRPINIHLFRKYPLKDGIKDYEEDLVGGKFQGANSPDFSDAVDLFTIPKVVDYVAQTNIFDNNKFQYFRYFSPDSSFCNIAEIEVFGIVNGKETKLNGEFVYNSEEGWVSKVIKAFDSNYGTYYDFSKPSGGWIGLDLGKKIRISRIKYCPRSDTNFIIDDNVYELFYWNNGWVSLGKQKGRNHILNYYSVPSNALYWLRNLSGGKEERIFTYENGKQVWW